MIILMAKHLKMPEIAVLLGGQALRVKLASELQVKFAAAAIFVLASRGCGQSKSK